MAEVWLARFNGVGGFQKQVVLKTILPHLAEDPEFVRMFINEALLAARLNHPNVVQIFDLGRLEGRYFIAMEHVAGRSFRQISRRRREQGELIPPWFVLRVMAAVCDGLYYAHEYCDEQGNPLGLVHRDVSPENIMVSFTGTTKILDFGVAKATTASTITKAGTLKGKYSYISPEQVRGSPADRRSDIYALGVILYEFLTGIRPFRGNNDLALLREIARGNPTPPRKIAPWLSEELEAIVLTALVREPDQRYDDAGRLGMDILEYLRQSGDQVSQRDIGLYVSSLFPEEPSIPSDVMKRLVSSQNLESPGKSIEPSVVSSVLEKKEVAPKKEESGGGTVEITGLDAWQGDDIPPANLAAKPGEPAAPQSPPSEQSPAHQEPAPAAKAAPIEKAAPQRALGQAKPIEKSLQPLPQLDKPGSVDKQDPKSAPPVGPASLPGAKKGSRAISSARTREVAPESMRVLGGETEQERKGRGSWLQRIIKKEADTAEYEVPPDHAALAAAEEDLDQIFGPESNTPTPVELSFKPQLEDKPAPPATGPLAKAKEDKAVPATGPLQKSKTEESEPPAGAQPKLSAPRTKAASLSPASPRQRPASDAPSRAQPAASPPRAMPDRKPASATAAIPKPTTVARPSTSRSPGNEAARVEQTAPTPTPKPVAPLLPKPSSVTKKLASDVLPRPQTSAMPQSQTAGKATDKEKVAPAATKGAAKPPASAKTAPEAPAVARPSAPPKTSSAATFPRTSDTPSQALPQPTSSQTKSATLKSLPKPQTVGPQKKHGTLPKPTTAGKQLTPTGTVARPSTSLEQSEVSPATKTEETGKKATPTAGLTKPTTEGKHTSEEQVSSSPAGGKRKKVDTAPFPTKVPQVQPEKPGPEAESSAVFKTSSSSKMADLFSTPSTPREGPSLFDSLRAEDAEKQDRESVDLFTPDSGKKKPEVDLPSPVAYPTKPGLGPWEPKGTDVFGVRRPIFSGDDADVFTSHGISRSAIKQHPSSFDEPTISRKAEDEMIARFREMGRQARSLASQSRADATEKLDGSSRRESFSPTREAYNTAQQSAAQHFEKGLTSLRRGDYAAALHEWEEALAQDPNNRVYQSNMKRLKDMLASMEL